MTTRKPYTGGPLNWLNGKAGISAPNRSVPVSRLVKVHQPKSAAELESLITRHAKERCECGIISQGTIEDFGRNLYEAQKKFWGEYRFSLGVCIQWEYDLFIRHTLKGATMESRCAAKLQQGLGPHFKVQHTGRYIDEELRIDLEILEGERCIAGVQVKPASFRRMRSSVISFNRSANSKFGKPVFYIYYNYDTEEFLNGQSVVIKILELSKPK